MAMTSLITDFQLLEGLPLRDFEAMNRLAADHDESDGADFGGMSFPAAPRPHPENARSRLAALAAWVGFW
jgi:hypothetical protein